MAKSVRQVTDSLLDPQVFQVLTFKSIDMHEALHSIQVEGRQDSAHQTHQYLPHLRPPQELLPVLHARFVLRPAHRGS